jgi:hypothetical protein
MPKSEYLLIESSKNARSPSDSFLGGISSEFSIFTGET